MTHKSATNDMTDKKQSSSRAPILLTILLLLASCCCAWLIWSDYRENVTRAEAENSRLQTLLTERERIRNLLDKSPCEIKEALEALKPTQRSSQPQGGGSASASPLNAAPTASLDAIEKGCVFIACLADKGISTGSGFFVAPGYVVTNRHVVNNGNGPILVTSEALGRPVIARLVASGKDRTQDYALLKLEMPPGARVDVLEFAPEVKKTEKVGAWGFPNLIGKNDPKYLQLLKEGNLAAVPELSYSEGVVSAVLNRDPNIIVHTAPISPGNSGGPLVNAAGEVIGINTMVALDEDSYRQASLALAAKDLEKFLAQNGVGIKISK